MKSGVYLIQSTRDDRIYVGSSVNIAKRFAGHLSDLRKKKHPNSKLQNFVNKYGIDFLEFYVLKRCSSDVLVDREQYYIDTLSPEFNICRRAGSVLGIKRSKESIEKTRRALIGRKCPEVSNANKKRVGWILSEEHKRKIGNANRGNRRPDLSALNKSRRGVPLSVEHRRKLCKSSKMKRIWLW